MAWRDCMLHCWTAFCSALQYIYKGVLRTTVSTVLYRSGRCNTTLACIHLANVHAPSDRLHLRSSCATCSALRFTRFAHASWASHGQKHRVKVLSKAMEWTIFAIVHWKAQFGALHQSVWNAAPGWNVIRCCAKCSECAHTKTTEQWLSMVHLILLYL